MNEIILLDSKLKTHILNTTKPSYLKEVRRFLTQSQSLSYEDIKQYIHDLKLQGYKPATINKHTAALKNMIRNLFSSPEITALQQYQLDKSLSDLNQLVLNKNVNAVASDKLISKSELQHLIENSPRDLALLMEFLYLTGCRISEALSIRHRDISYSNEVCSISITGKGNKARVIRVSASLIETITSFYKGDVYLFEVDGRPLSRNNVCNKIKRLSSRYLHRPITPHSFRHSFATNKIRETGKTQAVSEYLGHASSAITLDMYVHEVLEDSELISR